MAIPGPCLSFSPTRHVVLQVGSGEWLRQHDAIERLNIQAHQSAQGRSDEYIVDALVTHDRLSHLVHELLVAEVRSLLDCLPFHVLINGQYQVNITFSLDMKQAACDIVMYALQS